ncbi:ABC transporter substrate-binding protein [Desulfobulbus sp.]|jgi:polar amino acid transport system substrate-binding protein|uniref:ABC transporter substrate-binding protein n=1 Tax=Desulfobulbus sp. TaxID=895 RepID=UPI0027BA670E|nr:ABC transporter substrate-binding protein [Desulfobulbus sp.]
MIRKSLLLLVSALFLIGSHAVAATKLTNGIDANFPPFAFVDKTGAPSGFDVEAMNWIAKDMGVEVSHQPIEWDGIITSLVTKKIDIIASGMSITPDRAKQVNFTNPYWVIKQVMVVKKGSPLTVENVLSGKKILGVQQGTSEAKWLKEQATAKGWNFELRYYNSSPLAVEDVLNGRIDAAAMDDAPAKDAAAKKDVQVLGTFGMDTEEFGYAVRKDDQALLDKVNASLKKLMASPDWQALIKKYELEK